MSFRLIYCTIIQTTSPLTILSQKKEQQVWLHIKSIQLLINMYIELPKIGCYRAEKAVKSVFSRKTKN